MENLQKDFVTYNQALRLKALGFDEPCFGYYVDGELRGVNLGIEELGGVEPYYQRLGFHTLSNHDIDNSNKIVVTAPTFSQCFRWFRKVRGINVDIISQQRPRDNFIYAFKIVGTELFFDGFNTYEEAELACLDKLIEIVENKSE